MAFLAVQDYMCLKKYFVDSVTFFMDFFFFLMIQRNRILLTEIALSENLLGVIVFSRYTGLIKNMSERTCKPYPCYRLLVAINCNRNTH